MMMERAPWTACQDPLIIQLKKSKKSGEIWLYLLAIAPEIFFFFFYPFCKFAVLFLDEGIMVVQGLR